ncbi:MAG: hypothetical protein V7K92_03205 [Nostoc sp.]|uniref:hypothetical protein n=1 Tax=Nostoc sp. TaxID=1180 RepID=UPI002FF2E8D3
MKSYRNQRTVRKERSRKKHHHQIHDHDAHRHSGTARRPWTKWNRSATNNTRPDLGVGQLRPLIHL